MDLEKQLFTHTGTSTLCLIADGRIVQDDVSTLPQSFDQALTTER